MATTKQRLNELYMDFTSGVNNSLAGTIGAPVDIVNRFTGNVPNAFMGSDWIRNKMNNLGISTEGRGAAGFAGGLLGSMALPSSRLLDAIDVSAQIAQARSPTEMLLAAGGGLLGEAASALTKPKTLLDMTAYHGSPHDFDEFKLDKIGTGEGAQAYGHGLYFAESPDVAKSYRDALGELEIRHNGVPVGVFDKDPAANAAHNIRAAGGDVEKAVKRASNLYYGDFRDNVIKEIKRLGPGEVTESVRGKLYNVDIPDSAINNMLDWDKPLSEQPESVRKAFEKASREITYGPIKKNAPILDPNDKYTTAGDAYKALALHLNGGSRVSRMGGSVDGADKKASEYLKSLGIPGIRYLDGGSRGSGTGTRNFVVFDDKLVKILKKE